MSKSTAIATRAERAPLPAPVSVFASAEAFEQGQRMATALVRSTMVPKEYQEAHNQNALSNALVALDMANRMNIPPVMVMQNLDIIEGRPSWKSQFIIGALNSCGLFKPLRFEVTDRGERTVEFTTWGEQRGQKVKKSLTVRDLVCRATAIEKGTGEILEGPPVSIEMAIAEGWYQRNGSKWKTMPELMLRYRAAAFFGRLYAPHILNGMPTADESVEIETDFHELPTVDPKALAAPSAEEERKPGRPRGVSQALQRAKAGKDKEEGEEGRQEARKPAQDKPNARKAQPEPEPEDQAEDELEPEPEAGADDDGGEGDDMPFDNPDDDDDYSPA